MNRRQWPAALLMVAICATPGLSIPAAAAPRDVAELMPAESVAYVGWSQVVQDGCPLIGVLRSVVQGIARQDTDVPADALNKALDLLELAGKSSGGLGVLHVEAPDEFPLQGALIVEAGADAERVARTFHELLVAADKDVEIQAVTIDGVSFQKFDEWNVPAPLLWGTHDGHFVATVGQAAASKVVARLKGTGPSLAENEELRFCRQKVAAKPAGWMACGYVDVPGILAAVKPLLRSPTGPPPELIDTALTALGVSSVRAAYLHADEANYSASARLFMHIRGPMVGLLSLWQQEPLTTDDLKVIPKDAYWATTWNLDLTKLWDAGLQSVDQIAPPAGAMIRGVLATAGQMIGFAIPEEPLSAFGDTWALYDAPAHGGILLTGIVLVAEVRDAEKLQAILARLVEYLEPLVAKRQVALKLKETAYGSHKIHYVVIGGVPAPVAPAWGFVAGRWVFGLFPQTVATAMTQVDPATRKGSILDHPDVQAARRLLPEKSIAFAFGDSQYATRSVYPWALLVRTALSSWGAAPESSWDPAGIPTLAEELAGTRAFVRTCTVDNDGVLYTQFGRGPAFAALSANVATIAMTTSILLPSLSRARTLSKRAVSMANLRGIGQGMYVYANDHGDQFPGSLDDLIETDNITRQMLSSPFDASGTASYVYIAGQKEGHDARNVVAYERLRDPEGTCVLFLDGHVEFMKLDPFKQALLDTYKRLGREPELPQELERWTSAGESAPEKE